MASSDEIYTFLRSSCHTRENYTTEFFGQHLDVVVPRRPHEVRLWINRSLYIHRHRLGSQYRGRFIAGIGTQWPPSRNNRCPATIQICIGRRVLIFQILHSRSTPAVLYRLLTDRRITFVGYNIGYDCRLLKSHYNLDVTSTEELRSKLGMGNASMEQMVERYLGFRGVKKRRWISTSDWDALDLSAEQVQYAALDAYLSFQLGFQLVAIPILGGDVVQYGYRCNRVVSRVSDSSSTDSSPICKFVEGFLQRVRF